MLVVHMYGILHTHTLNSVTVQDDCETEKSINKFVLSLGKCLCLLFLLEE